jgi:hypothetical protein
MPELSMNAAQQGTPADVTKFAYANLAPRLSLGVRHQKATRYATFRQEVRLPGLLKRTDDGCRMMTFAALARSRQGAESLVRRIQDVLESINMLTESEQINRSMPDSVLYKLCRREHNIALGCTSIRIGNMTYYHRFEDANIGDTQEGVKSGVDSNMVGYDVRIHRMAPFNLIFCVATSNLARFSEYDSCYAITDPEMFGAILARELIEQMPPRDIDTYAPIVTLTDVYDVNVAVESRAVRYMPREAATAQDYTAGEIPFWKDVSYSHQEEFRYLFRFYDEHRLPAFSSCNRQYVDLDISHLSGVLPVRRLGP